MIEITKALSSIARVPLCGRVDCTVVLRHFAFNLCYFGGLFLFTRVTPFIRIVTRVVQSIAAWGIPSL